MKTSRTLLPLSMAMLMAGSAFADETTDTAKALADQAVSEAQDKAMDVAKDKAADMVDGAKDKAMDVAKDKAADMLGDAKDKAMDMAKDKASDLMDDAKDKAMDMAKDKAADMVEGAKDKAAGMVGAASGATEAAGEAPEAGMDPAMAEAFEKMAAVRPEHERLKAFEGNWTTTVKVWFGPGEPDTSTGTSRNSMVLGGRYVQMHYTGTFMGQPFNGIGLTGYDNLAGTYTSLWVDDASTTMALSTGQYDAASNSWTYTGEMADPMNPGVRNKLREVIRIESPDRHVLEWFETHGNEPEARTMEITYVRSK